MRWFFLFLALAFVTHIWLCFRVGRSSVALAIVTLLIGFPGALYTLFSERGDAETTVTVPFAVNLVCALMFFGSIWYVVLPALDAQQALHEETRTVVATAQTGDARPAARSASMAVAAPPAHPASTTPVVAAPVDPVDAFSAALRAGGLNHSLARVAAAELPAGVTDGAVFSVTPMSAIGSRVAAATAALSATLFRCASAADCKHLAATEFQQAGAERRRAIPNGLLLLSLPADAAEGDLTPAAVASAFRKL